MIGVACGRKVAFAVALCYAATFSLPALAGHGQTPPLPIYSPPPAYPRQVIGSSHGGTAVVLVLIDATGHVRDAKIERSSGERALDSAAIAAAVQWVFRPTLQDGRPVEGYVRIPFQFASSMRDDEGELASAYLVHIHERIMSHWLRPDSVAAGQTCRLELTQLPGGDVLEIVVAPACTLDDVGRKSLTAAVRDASPLPYAGFESVFRRQLEVNIVAP